jgi:hypothetical protein
MGRPPWYRTSVIPCPRRTFVRMARGGVTIVRAQEPLLDLGRNVMQPFLPAIHPIILMVSDIRLEFICRVQLPCEVWLTPFRQAGNRHAERLQDQENIEPQDRCGPNYRCNIGQPAIGELTHDV